MSSARCDITSRRGHRAATAMLAIAMACIGLLCAPVSVTAIRSNTLLSYEPPRAGKVVIILPLGVGDEVVGSSEASEEIGSSAAADDAMASSFELPSSSEGDGKPPCVDAVIIFGFSARISTAALLDDDQLPPSSDDINPAVIEIVDDFLSAYAAALDIPRQAVTSAGLRGMRGFVDSRRPPPPRHNFVRSTPEFDEERELLPRSAAAAAHSLRLPVIATGVACFCCDAIYHGQTHRYRDDFCFCSSQLSRTRRPRSLSS